MLSSIASARENAVSLETFFRLKENGTDVRTELVAGLTTFLTMAYIIFVNPTILGDAGMPKDAVFVATCLAAALGTLIMGLYANYPIGMAPGMGLNAYFAYAVVLGMGVPWQSALGAVFLSGCLFVLVSVLGLREMIVNGIIVSDWESKQAGALGRRQHTATWHGQSSVFRYWYKVSRLMPNSRAIVAFCSPASTRRRKLTFCSVDSAFLRPR